MLTRTVAPSVLPVLLADAKLHLRVTFDDEDAVIQRMLTAACSAVGEMTGRSLSAETWRYSIDAISGNLILPKSPVISVNTVTYYDANDTSQTYALSNLDIAYSDDRTILALKTGASWPVVMRRPDAISVTFASGYTAIPAELAQAILLLLGHWYANREASGDMSEIPYGVESCVSLYRLGWAAA